jgi:hypothetical protein
LSGQFVQLSATEWTSYDVRSYTTSSYQFSLRARTVQGQGPCELRITIGAQSYTTNILQNDWAELPLGTVLLVQGANAIKCVVLSGVADLDWFNLVLVSDQQ